MDIDQDLAVLRKVDLLDWSEDAIFEHSMQAFHDLPPRDPELDRTRVPRGRLHRPVIAPSDEFTRRS